MCFMLLFLILSLLLCFSVSGQIFLTFLLYFSFLLMHFFILATFVIVWVCCCILLLVVPLRA